MTWLELVVYLETNLPRVESLQLIAKRYEKAAKENGATSSVLQVFELMFNSKYEKPKRCTMLRVFLDTPNPMTENKQYLEWMAILLALLGNSDMLRTALLESPDLAGLVNTVWEGIPHPDLAFKPVKCKDGIPWMVISSAIVTGESKIVHLLVSYGTAIPANSIPYLEESLQFPLLSQNELYRTMVTQLLILRENHWYVLLSLMCGQFAHLRWIEKIFAEMECSGAVLDLIQAMKTTTPELRGALAYFMELDDLEIERILARWVPRAEELVYYNPNALSFFPPELARRINHLKRILQSHGQIMAWFPNDVIMRILSHMPREWRFRDALSK